MTNLLINETRSLQSIQKLKVTAQKDEHVEKTQKLLELMAKPYRWQLSNGTITLVQTQATNKASELLELYNALCNTHCITVDERLNVLYKLKQVITQSGRDYHDATLHITGKNKFKSNAQMALIRDITDLIDREGDMLNRGRPINTLENMRQRLNNLFLAYIENPIFNPRAIEFVNVPVANNMTMTRPEEDSSGSEGEEEAGDNNKQGPTDDLPIPPPIN